ncbi:MAG: hypothetical protein HY282_10700 [Nitrospirae bacterium]|nr:hypothetical protein [Candidatus Manganitrophaceae bacterium]
MSAIKRILFIATLLLIVVPGTRSFAEDDKFEFTIVPYYWSPTVHGHVTIGEQTLGGNAGVDQLLDKTDSAVMVQMEARFGRFGLFVQPNYLKVEDTQTVLNTNVDTTLKAWMTEFGGFFRIAELGAGTPHRTSFDLLIGGRYWGLETDTTASAPIVNVTLNNHNNTDVVEPFVGLRLLTHLTEHIIFGGRGDIGGFGISTNDVKSKLTWQAITFLGYEFNKVIGVEAGYRWLSIDMEDKNLSVNNETKLTFNGWIAGVSFRF